MTEVLAVKVETGKAGMCDPVIISQWPVIESHSHGKFVSILREKFELEKMQHRDTLVSIRLPKGIHALAAREDQKGSLSDSSTISKVGQAVK